MGVWPYGGEIWCSSYGQYVSIVREYEDISDVTSLSICDVAIFGNARTFERLSQKLESSYSLQIGEVREIQVSQITATDGTYYDVQMRLIDESATGFISIQNGSESAQITFAPTDESLSGLKKVIQVESFNSKTG